MANKFKIYPELNLFVHYYSGTISMADCANLMYKTMRHRDYRKTMHGLTDMRHTCMPMMEQQIDKFNSFAHKCPWIFGKIRGAVLINTTMQKKMAQIYKKEDDRFLGKIVNFIDIESALNWLNIPQTAFNEVELFLMSQTLRKDDFKHHPSNRLST